MTEDAEEKEAAGEMVGDESEEAKETLEEEHPAGDEAVVEDAPKVECEAGGSAQRYPSVPEEPDPPSYAPIFTGLGIATFAWGFLTNLTILFLGLAIFVFGLSIWIKELAQ